MIAGAFVPQREHGDPVALIFSFFGTDLEVQSACSIEGLLCLLFAGSLAPDATPDVSAQITKGGHGGGVFCLGLLFANQNNGHGSYFRRSEIASEVPASPSLKYWVPGTDQMEDRSESTLNSSGYQGHITGSCEGSWKD